MSRQFLAGMGIALYSFKLSKRKPLVSDCRKEDAEVQIENYYARNFNPSEDLAVEAAQKIFAQRHI